MAQSANNGSYAATTTSGQALPERGGRRTSFVITPVTAGVTVYIAKGTVAAESNKGVPIQVNQNYTESNSEGFKCWQGPIQIIGSASGTVAICETLEE